MSCVEKNVLRKFSNKIRIGVVIVQFIIPN